MDKYNTIRPGQPWLDTNGQRIQAHGGALIYENDTYYWYGENKDKTTGKNDIWTWGIRFYSSKDLYNWHDEGLIIPPEPDNKNSPMHPSNRIDRPHILYNRKTEKYVLWIKHSGDRACFSIFTADKLLGPYSLVKDHIRPYGKKAGDFDLVQDNQNGKAYLIFDSDHAGILTVELTDDYLDITDNHKLNFDDLFPPFCREAPAHFIRENRHYLITSGLTGYLPNPSETATFKNWFDDYEIIGNPHVNDSSRASFNSQISYIFKHPHKKDLYIALADRWVPDFVVTAEVYDKLSRAIASRYSDKYQATNEEKMSLRDTPMLATANTSIADYVWLPLRFDGDKVLIEWLDEWKIEDYE